MPFGTLSGITVGGLLSGLQVEDLVAQLISIERKPIDLLEQQKADMEQKLTVWQEVNVRLTALLGMISPLKETTPFRVRTATSSDPLIATVTAAAGTTPSTNSLTVNSLASTHRIESKGFASNTSLVSGGGSTTLTLAVGSGSPTTFTATITDTLDTLAQKINDAGMGITASVINTGAATNPYKLVLTSLTSGTGGRIVVGDGADTVDLRLNQAMGAGSSSATYSTDDLNAKTYAFLSIPNEDTLWTVYVGGQPVAQGAPSGLVATQLVGGSLDDGPDDRFNFKVVAVDSFGQTVGSASLAVNMAGGNGTVSLTWDAVSGAVSYKIFRAQDNVPGDEQWVWNDRDWDGNYDLGEEYGTLVGQTTGTSLVNSTLATQAETPLSNATITGSLGMVDATQFTITSVNRDAGDDIQWTAADPQIDDFYHPSESGPLYVYYRIAGFDDTGEGYAQTFSVLLDEQYFGAGFDADGRALELNWADMGGSNDGYVVYKSIDGTNWYAYRVIDGDANSEMDGSPIDSGADPRIQQTDEDVGNYWNLELGNSGPYLASVQKIQNQYLTGYSDPTVNGGITFNTTPTGAVTYTTTGLLDPGVVGVVDAGEVAATELLDLNFITTGDAVDASFVWNGSTYTRSSNTITDLQTGLTINLLKTGGPVTITVAADTASVKSSIQNFLDSYNSFMQFVSEQMTFDEEANTIGVLFNDPILVSLQRDVANIALSIVDPKMSTEFVGMGDGTKGGVMGDFKLDFKITSITDVTEVKVGDKTYTVRASAAQVFAGGGDQVVIEMDGDMQFFDNTGAAAAPADAEAIYVTYAPAESVGTVDGTRGNTLGEYVLDSSVVNLSDIKSVIVWDSNANAVASTWTVRGLNQRTGIGNEVEVDITTGRLQFFVGGVATDIVQAGANPDELLATYTKSTDYQSLTDIGVEIVDVSLSELKVDTTVLDKALADNLAGVEKLFAAYTQAIGDRLTAYVELATNIDPEIGFVETAKQGIQDQIDYIEDKIANFEELLEKREELLLKQFTQLEVMIAGFTGISQFLSQQLLRLPTSFTTSTQQQNSLLGGGLKTGS